MTMKATSVQDITQLSARSNRQIYVYTIPTSLAGFGVTSVGLVELSAEEEMLATKRASNDAVRLAFELARECLRQVNGKPVSTSDGSSDLAWSKMHPKVRNLIVTAFGHLHQPKDEEVLNFFQSRVVEVE